MKRPLLSATLAGLLLLAPLALHAALPDAPPTRTDNVTETLHGVTITDPYRWLEDQDSPETRAWIGSQNAYTDQVLGALPGRATLQARLEQLLRVDASGVPFEINGRYFFARRRADQQLSVLYVRQGERGADEVLVDPHTLSKDLNTSVNFIDISDDGTLAAIGTRQGGADEVVVTFLDINTRKTLADQLTKDRYFGVEITPDRKGIYYSRFEKAGARVYYHAFGSAPSADVLLFGEGRGPEQIIGVDLSEDGHWLLMTVYFGSASLKTEVWVKNLVADTPVTPIVNDIVASFTPAIAGDRLYLHTNWEAPKGRIIAVDLNQPARAGWKTVVAEQKQAVIDGYTLAGGKLFVQYLKDVASSVQVFTAAGKPSGEISFPALGSASGFRGRWASPEVFFTYSSFHIPTTIYRYDAASGKRTDWWRSQAQVKSDQFELTQEWFTSKDGTRVPMFVLAKKGMKRTGTAPTILYGYGGFQVTELPTFKALAVSWVEMGGVYAVASLRGGAEFGEAWHEAGMLGNKQNTFDDFIAASEHLIAKKITSASQLSIFGGSNGGLLVGACMTQRPELFKAVVCAVPLLDMIRYHQFLVARFWVPEFGSSENADQFNYLHAYSPYHHVTPGTIYPSTLFVSGDSDTRVAPLHARKMCALMQAATRGSDRPMLLHYDTQSGHSGGKPISKTIDDTADELLFLAWQLGMTIPRASNAGAGAAVGAGNAPQVR